MERIASGYMLAEAPVATQDGGLFFSDALAGGVYRWAPDREEVELVIPKRRGVGGMALHEDGGIIVSGRDVSIVRDDATQLLYADETAAGFNDLTVDPDGHVVVGTLRFNPFAGEAVVPGEFIRIDGTGDASVVIPGVEWVNGCAFSPEGATFYGCDYRRGIVLTADRRDDGGYGPARTVATSPGGTVDGMAVDENGALWVALGERGTIGRFRPDGELEAELDVPAGFVASLCFGGSDRRDLFITTLGNPEDPDGGGAVFMTRSPVPGAPLTRCSTRTLGAGA